MICLSQPGLEEIAVTDGDIRFKANEDAVGALSIALGQAQIAVSALVPESASLEELFLRLTGGDSSDHDRKAVA